MKSPSKQIPDGEAHDMVEQFIAKYARPKQKSRAKTTAKA